MKRLLFSFLFVLTAIAGWAQEPTTFTVGNFKYTVTDDENLYVSIAKADEAELSGALVIPSSVTYETVTYTVTSIADYGFYVNEDITEVTIPNTVTSIGENAFVSCSKLTTITLPSTLTTIGNSAFYGCSSLASFSVPGSVTTIGSMVFDFCSIPTFTFEASNTAITCNSGIPCTNHLYLYRDITQGFEGSLTNSIKALTIGANVTTIYNNMFNGSQYLNSIDFSEATGLTSIGDNAFYFCGNFDGSEEEPASYLTTVDLSNTKVTSIGEGAFISCSKLTTITLPSTLTTIGNSAFYGCSSLASFSVPGSVTTIGSMVFDFCSIPTFTFEASNTAITCNSGIPCTNHLYLYRDIIKDGALTDGNVKSLTIGANVTTIYNNMFNGFQYLNSIDFSEATGLTSIGDNAFYGCGNFDGSEEEPASYLTTVDLSNTKVTSIGEGAFYSCSKLTTITLPSTLTTIGNSAFYNCSALNSVTIPASVQTIGNQVFYYVDEMKNFTIEDGNTSLTIGDLGWGISGENFYLGRNVTYTSTLSGQLVFSNTQHVTIGPNVTTLNNNMFYERNRIKSIDLSHATSLTTIGDNVFYHCDSLENITIPATVTSIGYEAFLYTDRLNNVIFEDGDATLTMDSSIGSGLCGQSMYLGRNISGPTTRFVWTDCKTLTVGPKVTTLYANMFKESALETIDLTNATSLMTLGADVFGNCTNLTNVKVGWLTPLAIDDNAFNGSITHEKEAYATLNVPAGTKAAYAAADGWKNFEHVAHWSTLVTLTASAHGSIATDEATASNSTEQYRQPKEDAVVYTLTADEGYKLTALTDNDAAVSPLPTLGEEQARANTEGEEFVTLNASFTPITYNLTYTLNGGTATNPATYTIETTTFTLNNPTKAGYDFAGWKLNGVGEAMMTVTIAQGSTGHLAYTATWTPTVYNIVYTMDGGTATPDNPTTYTIETETFTLNNPTKTGHTFKGWKLNGEGDAMTEVTIAQGSTGHLAYTATWQVNKYTITFDSNGGSDVDPITLDYGSTVTAPDNPTKTGYDFAGWTPALPATMPAEDITVTANWTVKTYTVSITGTGVTADNMNPKYGDDVMITIAADEDRTLNTLTVNNVDVTAQVVNNQYTIYNVSSNITVVATFNSTKEYIILAQGVETFSCSQDLNFTGSELKAYIAAGYNKAESQVLLVRVYDVPAGTGLYLKGEAGVTYKIPYSTSQAYYVNMLKANLTASSIAKTSGDMSNFLLNKVEGEYGFFAPSETATLGAQKAYLQVPTSFMSGSEARAISIAFEDDGTTNISDFELFTNSNEHLYNLKGQRIEKAGRGLYIKNGKKVVIK